MYGEGGGGGSTKKSADLHLSIDTYITVVLCQYKKPGAYCGEKFEAIILLFYISFGGSEYAMFQDD